MLHQVVFVLSIFSYADPMIGLPWGKAPPDFLDMMFWALTTQIGQTYHRLVMPYRSLPFILANLIDDDVVSEEKRELASWFMALPRCCLDAATSYPLREIIKTEWDLLHGCGVKILQSICSTKTTNIEVENNFARAHSSKMTGRGRNEFVQSMSAKHLLSEIKLHHRKTVERAHKNGSTTGDQPYLPTQPALPPVTAESIVPTPAHDLNAQSLLVPLERFLAANELVTWEWKM